MKRSLGAYMNKSQSTYREIHSSRSSTALTQRKQISKIFTRHPNGIVVGPKPQNGLLLFADGQVVLNLKTNSSTKQKVFCYADMSYCYQITSESKSGTYTQLLFFKEDTYLMLYMLKNDRQDGFQFTYDYSDKKLTKSYYKNNQLRQIIETCTLNPRQAQSHPQFVDMFGKLSCFDFEVQGCKRLEISETMTYFGESKNSAPNGYGVILSLTQRYVGSFRDGLLEGFGTIFFANGDICQGLFIQGESHRCSRYTKPYGTIYFLEGKVSGEQQYFSIISEYKGRFTINSTESLIFPMRPILMQLKQNLQILESKKINRNIAQIKSQNENFSESPAKTEKQMSIMLQIPPAPRQLRRTPSRKSRLSVEYNFADPQLSRRSSMSPQKVSPQSNISPEPIKTKTSSVSQNEEQIKDNFFDSLRIQEVNEDTVAEEVKRNFPKSMQIQGLKERRSNEVNFIKQKEQRLIGNYLMQMIKQNPDDKDDRDRENSEDKAISMITDRIRKSRIFSGKKPRIDRVTFTF